MKDTSNRAFIMFDKDMVDFVACFEIFWASIR